MSQPKSSDLGKLLIQAASDYDIKTMRKVVSSEPPPEAVNYQNRSGNTALIMAVQLPREKDVMNMLTYLIPLNGMDINIANKQGQTALMFACKKGYGDAVRSLLSSKADLAPRDNDKKTAFEYASNDAILDILKEEDAARKAEIRRQIVEKAGKQVHVLLKNLDLYEFKDFIQTVQYKDSLDFRNEVRMPIIC